MTDSIVSKDALVGIKMRKYQKLLTKSYYARLLAVRRVTQDNKGKKTAGIDGIKNLPPMQRL
ncbi:MAG: reverse transcriptase N-terminal domain-containing protein, partial [Trichodesmium sp. St7_bin2_1]|nr:reverse transcriptase N-terminal domain-containing protein [Trichodesmium sp. St7_bin2_1]